MKIFLVIAVANGCSAFNAFTQVKNSFAPTRYDGPPPSQVNTESWLDILEYDQPPTFDVLSKTIDFATRKTYEERNEFLAEDYVFRGPIIGPISFEDVKKTQQGFQITDAFPNLETRPFGFTIGKKRLKEFVRYLCICLTPILHSECYHNEMNLSKL